MNAKGAITQTSKEARGCCPRRSTCYSRLQQVEGEEVTDTSTSVTNSQIHSTAVAVKVKVRFQ